MPFVNSTGMMIYKLCISLLLLFSFFDLNSQAQGYQIKLTAHGVADTTVILGHYLNQSMYPDDTITLNHKGEGVFRGKNNLPGGMYILFFPDGNIIEFFLDKDQTFSIELDTVDLINSLEFNGSEENIVFNKFQRYMLSKREEVDALQKALHEAPAKDEKEKIQNQIKKLTDERKNKIYALAEKYPGYLSCKFLKATLEIDIPDPPRDENGNLIDSLWQYKYYRNHYFDNFDVSDVRLLHTPIYEDKIMAYLNRVIPQIPDTIIVEVDKLIEQSRSDSALFRYMLITLFNYYGKSDIMGMDAVQVHMADKYYIQEAWWSSEEFIKDLKERVEILKPLLIGKTAPDVKLRYIPADHFKSALQDTALKRYPHAGAFFNISDVKADYVVLIFWEADCGHCKKILPRLYELYEDTLATMNVQVVAISTLFGEEGKIDWIDFVNNHGLYSWINAWNPYDYQFKIIYDIRSTPQIFILDQEKKIIAKRIGVEQIQSFIEMHKKISRE